MLNKFPNYSFVPKYYPHPVLSPQGHSYNEEEKDNIPIINEENYSKNEFYLYSLELFNRGYYWETHEILESMWKSLNKEGYIADFLKGIIKLAASGVKIRQKQLNGIYIHSKAAKELFEKVKNDIKKDYLLGLNILDLINDCQYIMDNYDKFKSNIEIPIEKVFNFELKIS